MRFAALLLSVIAVSTAVAAQDVVNSDALVANSAVLDGKTVTLGPCNLFATDINGQMTCRLKNADGSDFKDPSDLPVDLFIDIAGAGQSVKDYIAASCDSYQLCEGNVLVTGPVKIGILGGVTFTAAELVAAP